MGTPEAFNHYAVGWAHAMDTPYQWTQAGGLTLAAPERTVVHWNCKWDPSQGEVRNQFHHVIDAVPTILESGGIPAPLFVNEQQAPLEGFAMNELFVR